MAKLRSYSPEANSQTAPLSLTDICVVPMEKNYRYIVVYVYDNRFQKAGMGLFAVGLLFACGESGFRAEWWKSG